MYFSWKIALRYFSTKRREKLISVISWFSLFGVIIGVAALIVVMAVMNGFRLEIISNIVGLNSDITITANNGEILPQELLTQINKPYIKAVIPMIHGQALCISNNNALGVMIRGIDPPYLVYKRQLTTNLRNIQDISKQDHVFIGNELAQSLGSTLGSKIRIISPNAISSIMGSLPRMKTFIVAGIFKSGLYDYDSAAIIMNSEDARKFFGLKGTNLIEVYTQNYTKSTEYASLLKKDLNNPNLEISSWETAHQQFLSTLKVERITMFVILTLIIVVAAFNIISMMFMTVRSKTKDIAILRSIGVPPKTIMFIFLIEGSIIGVLGTFLGSVVGIGLASNIDNIRKFLEKLTGVKLFEAAFYFLYHLPSKIIISDVVYISVTSIVLCIIAAIYPAYKASTMDPIDIMRYE